jgi:hypothetical protein
VDALSLLTPDTAQRLEQLSVITPFGIRFWDEAYQAPVGRGLQVTAYPLDQTCAPVDAVVSLGGIYVLQGLPGLAAVEHPVGGRSAPASGSLRFALTVADTLGRFTPVEFGVALPLTYRGLFAESDPATPGARFFLYSAPTRPVLTGMAAIRVQLWDRDVDQPAAYALLAVNLLGATRQAIADERGCCLVEIPWPTVESLQAGSPPGLGQGAPGNQTWPITITAFYAPQSFVSLLAQNGYAGATWTTLPRLKGILGQTQAALWTNAAGPPTASWITNLTFGSELILRSTGSAASRLLISRGSSPP